MNYSKVVTLYLFIIKRFRVRDRHVTQRYWYHSKVCQLCQLSNAYIYDGITLIEKYKGITENKAIQMVEKYRVMMIKSSHGKVLFKTYNVPYSKQLHNVYMHYPTIHSNSNIMYTCATQNNYAMPQMPLFQFP